MALPALLGAGARAVGGSMVKTGGRAVAAKVLGRGRKKQAQPGRIVPGREGVDGGKGGAIIKPKVKMVSAKEIKSLQTGDTVSPGKDPLKSIYSNVILIEKILKGTNIADRDALKEQKKHDKKTDKEAQEKKLETKPTKIDKAKGLIKKVPGMGIFGMIKNFIGKILLGYFAVRLVKYLPQLMNMLTGLTKVIEFITDVGIFLVDGIATFIDFAYNVYDGTRNIMKGIGLEGAFDAVMKAVEVAITVLTFALGAKSLGGFGDSRGGKDKPGRSKPQTRIAGPKGNLLGSQDRVTSTAAARRYANRFGRDAAEKRFGKDAVSGLGGKFGRSRVTNFARGAATGVAKKLGGRQGVKMLASLGKIGKFLKVPVIGSIISVVISLMNGDPIQKALFKGVGTAVGGALGGFLSTFIGVPPLGLFLGGIIGDYVGDLLYTLFFGGGLKEAGAKLGNDLKGLFMGIGDGVKAIFSWVFGGGLLDLLKNVGGGLLKFAGYILNPGGLLWDMLKAGGAVVGAITNFLFGGGLLDLIKNVGGGVLKFIGYILMPNGLLFDALKAGGAAAKMIFDFAKSIVGNLVGGAVEGTKRVAGGFFDALTFNLFDFDKQNKVETKKAGGEVGRGFQEDTLKQQRKSIRKKPSFTKIKPPEGGKVKTGEKTERAWWDFLGWAGTEGQEETMDLGPGGQMLANKVVNIGNSFGEYPYFGPILSLAAKVILGETPTEEEYKNVGYGLNMLVGDGVQKGKIGEGIKGYEDGGMIDDYYAMAGIDIGRWATDTFKKELSTTLYKDFNQQNMTGQGGDSSTTTTTTTSSSSTSAVVTPGAASGAVAASELYKEIGADAEQWDIFRNSVALIESNGKYDIFGGSGDHYDGRYQMGRAAKIDGSRIAGVSDPRHSDDPNAEVRAKYRANPELQETVFTGFTVANHRYLMRNATYKDSSVERKLQILGYAHNQGMGGAESWITTGVVGKDGFGTKGTKYTDLIAANFRAQKSGGELEIASGAVTVPHPEIGSDGMTSPVAGQFGLSDPTPGASPGVPGSTGYASDSGLDIIGRTGDPIVSPVDGTILYAETGHTSWKDDSNPDEPGHQPQHSFLISLASPFEYGGKKIKFAYGTHLSSLVEGVANQSGIAIKAGQPIGAMGVANKVPHLHFGLLQNRAQSSEDDWLSNTQVKEVLSARRSHAGTKLSNREEMLRILPGQSLLDENTSKALGATNLARFNAASTPEGVKDIAGQIAGVSDYAPYEQGAQQTVVVQDPPQQEDEYSESSGSGGMTVVSGSSHDPFEFLDFQG